MGWHGKFQVLSVASQFEFHGVVGAAFCRPMDDPIRSNGVRHALQAAGCRPYGSNFRHGKFQVLSVASQFEFHGVAGAAFCRPMDDPTPFKRCAACLAGGRMPPLRIKFQTEALLGGSAT